MNNYKSIPRSEFFTYCQKAFESFRLSSYMTDRYLRCIEYISQYMEDMGIDSYDLKFSSIFQEKIAKADNSPNRRKSRDYSCALSLIDRFTQGLPYVARRKHLKTYSFPPNELGDYAKKFIEHIKTRKCKDTTLLRYQHSMSNIVNGLSEKGCDSPSHLTRTLIIDSIASHRTADNWYFYLIDQFLNYLAEQDVIPLVLAHVTYGQKPPIPKPLPSYYTAEEVKKIEMSFDRGTLLGKRNYAMVLLASRLGLRASDICLLQLDSLDWKNNRIKIVQSKTGKDLELPLLADIGNAIIDYLKYARPKAKSNMVFLSQVEPYRPISTATLSGAVSKAIHRAGIETIGRHVGTHTLRHSLATSMMKTGSSIQAISETLGHSDTRATMEYLNVDIDSLMECSHEVPPVDESYYTQKGGALYV
ncbi:site-specific integrase [Bacteroides ovatus]|jgi:integrase|uniref:site-specific integrase n=1 Tax=Bacteroides ovatus TaxID=28116 RepID=UPI001F174CA0|nr:site-specific integrase [Bacteroides ovatus]MCE8922536.1 tyrosine-type recombinase/integrase [Bacteroides ovatus]